MYKNKYLILIKESNNTFKTFKFVRFRLKTNRRPKICKKK